MEKIFINIYFRPFITCTFGYIDINIITIYFVIKNSQNQVKEKNKYFEVSICFEGNFFWMLATIIIFYIYPV